MVAYLIRYRNYLEDTRIEKYATADLAAAALAVPSNDPHEGGFEVFPDSNLGHISSKCMVDLFNLWRDPDDKVLTKFENRTIARQRFLARLEARAKDIPVIEEPAKPIATEPKETDMAQKAAKKAKTERAPKVTHDRIEGKPAGLVADFRPIREGTDRQKVLKLMNGTKTPEGIATQLEFVASGGKPDVKKVLTIAYCIARDSAIGYRMTEGKMEAIYPGSKTYSDAVKKAEKAD